MPATRAKDPPVGLGQANCWAFGPEVSVKLMLVQYNEVGNPG